MQSPGEGRISEWKGERGRHDRRKGEGSLEGSGWGGGVI